MDESALQRRLRRIEQRQTLVLALLVGAYVVGVAELVGYWMTAVLGAAVGAVAFVVVAVRRRRRRDAAGE